ncbi:sodium-coupled monocarboxylate transporter 2 [Plakobranchus ocellatus]|uniref:Sodium-coupled monocarboxylate transporter 2 n=1 Tax=Plakobranchus ocellatus TaxID=259542 RepID=A0AAV3YV37_9GAST|nr:sodium-coupled monocarboxylate transporter 2 [Plakobranchus ocellatus]
MGDDYSYNTGEVKEFGVVDYVLFVLTLVISAGIGVFYAILDRNRNTPKDFLLGGRNMSVLPVALSLMVTFMSAMTLLGNPAEIYNYHTMFWWLVAAFLLAMTFAAHVFIPFFYRLGVTCTFEYLDIRFGHIMRVYGSILLILQTLIYAAFLLYAPSLALNAVTGVDLWGCCIGMGCVVTFYTTLGGMKAVLWTDSFQAGVIFAGLLAVLIKGSMVEGGFDKAWQIADDHGRIRFDDFSPDPKTRHSVWSMVIGGWGFWMYLYGVNQAQVQRCLSCPSVKKAQMAMWVNLPGLIFIVSAACMIGIVMFAFYVDCHPISYGIIDKTDQLVPLYVMDILGDYPGLPGVFVSCVVSGSLSSLSSGLNALSAVTLELLPARWLRGASQFKTTVLSKLMVFFYGVLAICLAYVVSKLGSVLEAVYTVFGILNGPLLGVFTLGMFYPWANKRGALVGTTVALGFLLWVGIAAFVHDIKTPVSPLSDRGCNYTARPTPAPPNVTAAPEEEDDEPLFDLYRMSYMYYTSLGMVIVQGVGIVVSLLTGKTDPKSLDPRLICPVFEVLIPCLPLKVRDFLRFGIVHEGKYDVETDIHGEKPVKDASVEFNHIENGQKPPLNGTRNPSFTPDEPRKENSAIHQNGVSETTHL